MNPLDPSSPFSDPLLAHYQTPDGSALDPYRSFFVARLSGKTLVRGVWNYSWEEQTHDHATGLPTDGNPRRAGGIVGGLPFHPAIEINNSRVPIGTMVFCKQVGIANGQTYYEFDAHGVPDVGSGSGSGSGPANCYASVRLPCWFVGSGSGDGGGNGGGVLPCFSQLVGGTVYYPCDGTGPDGFGAVALCDGRDGVELPQQLTVTATGGTRSFGAVGTLTATATRSGGTWPVAITAGRFRLDGALAYCCDADVPGFYFSGEISSTYDDPDEAPDPDNFWCGCARVFAGCPPCSQVLVSGPTYDPFTQTLLLDVGCGTIELQVVRCADPDHWGGAGWYWVSGHGAPVSIEEGEQCGVAVLCGPYPDYPTALAAFADCFGTGSGGGSGGGGSLNCCALFTPTGGSVTLDSTTGSCLPYFPPAGFVDFFPASGIFTTSTIGNGYSLTLDCVGSPGHWEASAFPSGGGAGISGTLIGSATCAGEISATFDFVIGPCTVRYTFHLTP